MSLPKKKKKRINMGKYQVMTLKIQRLFRLYKDRHISVLESIYKTWGLQNDQQE